MLVTKINHFLEETIEGLLSLLGFHDQAGDLIRVLIKEFLDAIEVVVTELYGEIPDSLRDAGCHGRAADEPVISGKERMVGAHCDQITAGISPTQFNCRSGNI